MQRDRQKLFLEGPIGVALFRLAVPIILANVLQTGYQLTDAFWVGRLGASAVAAVSVSFPVTFLVIALGSGLGIAGATLSAQYMGAGRQDMVNHVAAQTMLMVFITSVILGTTGYMLAPYLLHWMGVEADVYRDGLAFMRVSFVGIIFVFLFAMFQALMRGIGQTTIPLLIVLGTVLLNIVLDPMFIFGWGPIPEQGVRGAALATLTTQGIAAMVGMIVFLLGRHGIQLRLADFRPDFPYIKRAFLLGAPGSVELSTRALGLIVLSFLVASFGTVTIASYGVGANVLQFVMIPAMGLSMAVSTLVGQNIGAGNTARASKVAILGACWGFGILTTVGIVAFAFAPNIVGFFVPDDQAVIDHGAEFIRVMSLAWGGLGIQLCMIATFRASGNFLISMVIALVSQWMLQFPVAYILSKHTPLEANGIWWSFPVMHGLMAVVAAAWFAQGGWKKTRITDRDDQVRQVTEETIVEDGLP
ncbi:MATE family efflux transporter [Bremerella cremea]|uniref:MATE family efflux transporter n=1 Tax=Blastopirellula marina TaxID=124 RepID=A0A2S8FE29_9BACT|nr:MULTISPECIES: MATE family efflux transporter [Pirellulaceae]PQO30415.1 MATE family efflux transporter [Blastopirellula marina]RCS43767.1 MATE family efflux transporter [Bremerella cremea]